MDEDKIKTVEHSNAKDGIISPKDTLSKLLVKKITIKPMETAKPHRSFMKKETIKPKDEVFLLSFLF